jgi:superfamily II DNA/RNA helicase
MAELFERAQNGKLPMLLANLVISLGIDIENLNNMVMLGAPRKMTEQVQTAGRTGRGNAPGHVTMHLLPSNPRDVYLYANFHRVLGDVEGYFETAPIQPTNAHAADLLLPNLLKAVLAGMSYEQFVLTTRRASMALSDAETENQLRYDLLRLLRTDDTPQDLVVEINQTVQRRLKEYEHKWGRIDNTVYLSEWFQREGNMMYTLRKGSDRHIDIDVEQDDLLDRLDRDYTVSATS